MDGNEYFQQQLNNGKFMMQLIAMAAVQEAGQDDKVIDIMGQIIEQAFNAGKNDEQDVQYKAGNALHR